MRSSRFVLALAAASFLLPPVSAQHAGAGGVAPPRINPNDPGTRPDQNQNRSGGQRVDDRKFLEDAEVDGLTEVALGKLAVEKGSSDAVKQFGQKMIDHHTKANEEMKQLAASGGVTLPDAIDDKHQSRVDKLAKLSGAEFDKAYGKDQQKFYQLDIKAFQAEADGGGVPQVKELASKALPTLQEHLSLAKEMGKKK